MQLYQRQAHDTDDHVFWVYFFLSAIIFRLQKLCLPSPHTAQGPVSWLDSAITPDLANIVLYGPRGMHLPILVVQDA